MTAEEFLINERIYPELSDPDECDKVRSWMIDFAKYHVSKALEAASKNAELMSYEERGDLPEYYEEPFNYIRDDLENITAINIDSILKAYPESNIT